MNLLPFVTAFILIFSVGIYGFFHQTKNIAEGHTHYFTAFDHKLKVANGIQKQLYKKCHGDNLNDSKKNSKTATTPKSFASHRDSFDHYPQQKLNVRPLLSDNPSPQLKTITLTLIKNLYQHTHLYTPDLEKELLDLILSTLKAHPTVTTFEELFSHISSEKLPLFYKLIRGTHIYSLYENKGYPPLGDFLRLDQKKGLKPLYLRSTCRPVLEAAFGSSIASAIIREEKQKSEISGKKETLTKEEFTAFFLKHRIDISNYNNLIDFSINPTCPLSCPKAERNKSDTTFSTTSR